MGKMRDWVNNNSAVVTVGAVVLLLISLAVIVYSTKSSSGVRNYKIYFYDLNSGQLFAEESTKLPPIDTPTGKDNGVWAFVYGCGDCSEANRFIGYLQKLTPEMKEAQLKAQSGETGEMMPPYEGDMDQGTLIRLKDSGEWVPMYSEEGQKIMTSIEGKCPADQRPKHCRPD
ncbi:MAG: hypothetical protein WD042_18680 [Phycisphaeraceae bacterium]